MHVAVLCIYSNREHYQHPSYKKSIYNSNSILYRTWSAGCMTKSSVKRTHSSTLKGKVISFSFNEVYFFFFFIFFSFFASFQSFVFVFFLNQDIQITLTVSCVLSGKGMKIESKFRTRRKKLFKVSKHECRTNDAMTFFFFFFIFWWENYFLWNETAWMKMCKNYYGFLQQIFKRPLITAT